MDRKHKKKYRDFRFDDFYDEIERLEDMMDSLIEDMPLHENSGEFKRKPVIMGFSLNLDSEGKPIIKEFGNVRRQKEKTVVTDVREPLIDISQDAKTNVLTITSELPGIEKKDIDLINKKNKLIVSVKGDKAFYKEILLPKNVLQKTSKAKMKNGILEISYKLQPLKSNKKKTIHIE